VDERVLRRLAIWMRERKLALADLTPQCMDLFLEELRTRLVGTAGHLRPVTSGTISSELRVLHVFFRYLVDRDVILIDPVRGACQRVHRLLCGRGVFSESEVTRLFAVLQGDHPLVLRDRAMIALFYGAGLRLAELAALELPDYDAEHGLVHVVQGKGNKSRVVPVGPVAQRDVADFLVRGRPFLVHHTGCAALVVSARGRRLSRAGVAARVRVLQHRAGIVPVRGTHAFRHAFATHLLAHGADITAIQRLLGHASLALTALYTHVDLVDLRRVLARAHPRERRDR
jgi:integrase/recombinase XerD